MALLIYKLFYLRSISGYMKLAHLDAPPTRKPARAATAALSAFFLCSCATPFVMRPELSPRMPDPVSQPEAPVGAAEAGPLDAKGRSLPSTWERGQCVFEDGRFIIYSDVINSQSRSLRVDSDSRGARSVLCSENFTVLMLADRAIISLGGSGVLGGSEMLGLISGRFISANSYEVSLKPVIAEDGGVSSPGLSGAEFTVLSRAGRRWSIDLSDPYAGWNVY